ncbi:MAG: beta-propeller domain-containing protein [Methylococcales bacterium]|nr:beta-propeller domain-containing protein [Methylococcales bacterium]
MKKNTLLLLGCFSVTTQANSISLVPILNDTESINPNITYNIKNLSDRRSNTFMTTEPIKLHFSVKVKKNDIGEEGSLYLVAHYRNKWYQKTIEQGWQLWDKKENSLLPFKNKRLRKEEKIIVLNDEILSSGEFLVYGAYKTNKEEHLYYNKIPASLLIFDKNKAALHQVESSSLLASYFAHGRKNNLGKMFTAIEADFSPTNTSSAGENSVSQTNIQEAGVDEADLIKTDGEYLYALEKCKNNINKQCITSYSIQASPANNTQLQQFNIGNNKSGLGNIYLSPINNKKHLIHLGNSSNIDQAYNWCFSNYWLDNQTDIKIVDVSQPKNMSVNMHITMDSHTISSRLINGTLYLITRKDSFFTHPEDIAKPQDNPEGDTLIFNPTIPKDQTIKDLLPTISFNDGADAAPVVQATDCYIPNKHSNKQIDNTIITITAIPLDNPKAHYSSCIAGTVDTFYMSTSALYLATSRHDYVVTGNDIKFVPELSEMKTEIHKFALAEGALDYRGSGSVEGHLGWSVDKRPFRMGEYNGILKIATSKGNSWGESTSTTRVSVLREATNDKKLEEIGFLDNLGKPDEQLFAARFIKDKGYLVTFKQTDPLYVLDFSQPEQPSILGALEINGYSDYLHPIGDNYLLGIGKDAIPSAANPEQGAFYQGVKLSLFDVSSAKNLKEISSVIIGKRGTQSGVLFDHHALAWLPSNNNESATLAIPIQLNESKLNNQLTDYNDPSAYYGWTHTGLYTFNILTGETPNIKLQGKLISDIPPKECSESGNYCSFTGQYTHNDRAVIQNNTIHYIHNNTVLSSEISDLK